MVVKGKRLEQRRRGRSLTLMLVAGINRFSVLSICFHTIGSCDESADEFLFTDGRIQHCPIRSTLFTHESSSKSAPVGLPISASDMSLHYSRPSVANNELILTISRWSTQTRSCN